MENYVNCFAGLKVHGIHLDDKNKQAIKDYVDSTLQPTQAHMLQDTPAKELSTSLLVAKRKREELIKEGDPKDIRA